MIRERKPSEVIVGKNIKVMKIFIYILMALALAVIVYNATLLDFDDLLAKDSSIALIGIVAAAIVIVLLGILLTSKAIDKKHRS